MRKNILVLAVAVAMGATGVKAAQQIVGSPTTTFGNNFTAIDRFGGTFIGTNDISASWDGTIFTDQTDYIGPGSVSNLTLSSDERFFIGNWTTHDIQIFGPGNYTFDTTLGEDNPFDEVGAISMLIGTNQLGAHMLFDWNGTFNIDIVMVWDLQQPFGPSPLFTGGDTGAAGDNTDGIDYVGDDNIVNAAWDLSVADGNGDGISGIPMVGGPFLDTSFSFNINGPTLSAVPVPTALWLFLSGLVGLGIRARHK